MRFQVVHHGRKWTQVNNHLDNRHCPDCGASVSGNHGQSVHQKWHLDLADLLEDLSERVGAASLDDREPVPWTAAVDETDDQKAIG